jgi:hypothetical protein
MLAPTSGPAPSESQTARAHRFESLWGGAVSTGSSPPRDSLARQRPSARVYFASWRVGPAPEPYQARPSADWWVRFHWSVFHGGLLDYLHGLPLDLPLPSVSGANVTLCAASVASIYILIGYSTRGVYRYPLDTMWGRRPPSLHAQRRDSASWSLVVRKKMMLDDK